MFTIDKLNFKKIISFLNYGTFHNTINYIVINQIFTSHGSSFLSTWQILCNFSILVRLKIPLTIPSFKIQLLLIGVNS